MMIKLLGMPPSSLLTDVRDPKLEAFLEESGRKARYSFEELMPQATSEEMDLLKKLLVYDPKKRLSAKEALKHPYFKDLHDAEDEPEGQEMDYFDFEFENYNLDKEILRELILDEVLLYHNKEAKRHYQ
jgi:serine/threonine protein kinase